MATAEDKDVRVAVSPYRICPLGAHIDHQAWLTPVMQLSGCTSRITPLTLIIDISIVAFEFCNEAYMELGYGFRVVLWQPWQ